MDQFYFEEGYLEPSYFAVVREAEASLVITATHTASGDIADTTGYYIPDYIAEGYYALPIKEFAAALSTTATQSTSAFKIQQFSSDLTVSVSVTATISHIEGADLFAFTEAQISVAVDRIRDNNIAASDQFNIAIDYIRQRDVGGDVSADTAVSTDIERSRDFQVVYEAAFSTTSAINGVLEALSDLTTVSAFTAELDGVKPYSSDLTAETTVSATISHIHGADLQAFSDAALTASADRLRGFDCQLQSENLISLLNDRFRGIDSQITVDANISAVGNYGIGNFSASTATNFVLHTTRTAGSYRPRNFVDGNYQFSDSIYKFGTHSVQINGSLPLRYFRGITNPDLDLIPDSNQSFVIETWFYFVGPDATTSRDIFAQGVGAGMSWRLFWRSGSSGGDPRFETRDTNGNVIHSLFIPKGSASQSNNQWVHLLVVKNSQAITLYQDGQSSVNSTSTSNLNLNFYRSADPNLRVGFNWATNKPYYDNVSYHIGTTLGYDPTQSTITVPTSVRQNTVNTIALYHFDNNVLDDTTLLQDAVANINTAFTKIVNAGLLLVTTADLSSIVTISATGEKNVVEYSADLSCVAALASDVNYTASNAASLAAEITQSTQADRRRGVQVVLQSQIQQITDFNRTRDNDSQIAATASLTATISHIHGADLEAFSDAALTATAEKTVDAESLNQSSFTTTVDGARLRDVDSEQNSEFTIGAEISPVFAGNSAFSTAFSTEITANRLRDFNSAQNGVLDLNVDAQRLRDHTAALTAESTVAATALRIFDFTIATESIATQLSVVAKTGSALIDAGIIADITALATAQFQAAAAMVADSAVTAQPTNTYPAEADLATEFAQTATATADLVSASGQSAEFSIIINAVKDSDIVLNLAALSNVTAINARTRDTASTQATEFSLVSAVSRTRDFSIQVTAESTVSATATKTADAGADLVTETTISATISHIEGAELIAFSDAQLVIEAFVGVVGQSDLTAESNISATALRIKSLSSDLSVSVDVSTEANYQISAAIDTQSVSTQTTVGELIASAVSTQISVSQLSCTISHIHGADLQAFSDAALSVTVSRTRSFDGTLASTATLAAVASATKSFEILHTAEFLQQVTATRILSSSVDLQAQSTILAQVNTLASGTVNIASAMVFVSNVREIDINSVNQYLYVIPEEDREFTIQEETRIFKVRR